MVLLYLPPIEVAATALDGRVRGLALFAVMPLTCAAPRASDDRRRTG